WRISELFHRPIRPDKFNRHIWQICWEIFNLPTPGRIGHGQRRSGGIVPKFTVALILFLKALITISAAEHPDLNSGLRHAGLVNHHAASDGSVFETQGDFL